MKKTFWLSLGLIGGLAINTTFAAASPRLAEQQYTQTETATKQKIKNDAVSIVNINTATVEELAAIKFFSLTKARKIVAYREDHGPFKSLDELLNVQCRGIHEVWLARVTPYLTI